MTAITNAQRQARHRLSRIGTGHQVITVTLTPAATRALAGWQAAGYSKSQAVSLALAMIPMFGCTSDA